MGAVVRLLHSRKVSCTSTMGQLQILNNINCLHFLMFVFMGKFEAPSRQVLLLSRQLSKPELNQYFRNQTVIQAACLWVLHDLPVFSLLPPVKKGPLPLCNWITVTTTENGHSKCMGKCGCIFPASSGISGTLLSFCGLQVPVTKGKVSRRQPRVSGSNLIFQRSE